MIKTAQTYGKLLAGLAAKDLDSFIELLKADGATLLAPAIMEAARQELARKAEANTITVRTASPLTSSFKDELGERGIVQEVSDPSLINGLIIESAGLRIDASIAGCLQTLATALKN